VRVLSAWNVPNRVAQHVLVCGGTCEPLLVSQIFGNTMEYSVDIGKLLLKIGDRVHGSLLSLTALTPVNQLAPLKFNRREPFHIRCASQGYRRGRFAAHPERGERSEWAWRGCKQSLP